MRISDWSSDVCSSDLNAGPGAYAAFLAGRRQLPGETVAYLVTVGGPVKAGSPASQPASQSSLFVVRRDLAGDQPPSIPDRSEEHTSELQSLMRISYAVFCLKKKTNI